LATKGSMPEHNALLAKSGHDLTWLRGAAFALPDHQVPYFILSHLL
jgi:hypothetical protein